MQVTAEMAACVTVEALLLPGVQALAWVALLVLVLVVARAGQLRWLVGVCLRPMIHSKSVMTLFQ